VSLMGNVNEVSMVVRNASIMSSVTVPVGGMRAGGVVYSRLLSRTRCVPDVGVLSVMSVSYKNVGLPSI